MVLLAAVRRVGADGKQWREQQQEGEGGCGEQQHAPGCYDV